MQRLEKPLGWAPGPGAGRGEVDPGQLVLPLRCACLLPREKGRVQLKAEEEGDSHRKGWKVHEKSYFVHARTGKGT